MPKKKQTTKKIRLSGVIFLLLLGYLIFMIGYSIFASPIKNIVIKGNNNLTETELLEAIGYDNQKSSFKLNSVSIRKKLEKLELVKKAKVKKSIFGTVEIKLTENRILFFNELNSKYVLSNAKEIEAKKEYIGYPTLINYVTSDIYKKIIKSLSEIDEDIIKEISEIEYNPNEYNGTILDPERFLLRMNDGNIVYINAVNIEKLNNYQTIVASVNETGVLYLDSNSDNYIFNTKNEAKVEEETPAEEQEAEEEIETD